MADIIRAIVVEESTADETTIRSARPIWNAAVPQEVVDAPDWELLSTAIGWAGRDLRRWHCEQEVAGGGDPQVKGGEARR